ncbi:hypothetical protein SAMD00019534_014500 [Acytostelium subglobosum LB1]|uniref:hypothetical protein n=1 Tax=Acytostelium subglobosum LB1 TaxID=1410327 RepID=UPI0006449A47|nr:hypothetical protein SAMD00019534_014500 [Acytostelium subglobosum LB1]GAM18275.1 hypothetical protein SAMD00019534_014500 [Acytostelium subglobosum LB1]|eukprot:XP_012758871.1 hypothetical protein SAMD00019534_014500 [Acytostelium subglobosum LB1]
MEPRNKNNRKPTEIGVAQIVDPRKSLSRIKSPEDGVTFLSYTGSETTEKLYEALAGLRIDLQILKDNNNIMEIDGVYYRVTVLYGFDLVCASTVTGMCGMHLSHSTYRCILCHCTNDTIKHVSRLDQFTLRTLESIKHDADMIKAKLDKGTKTIVAKNFHGMCTIPPLIIDPLQFILDSLHSIMGVVKFYKKRVLDFTEDPRLSPEVRATLASSFIQFLKDYAKLHLCIILSFIHSFIYSFM